MSPATGIAAAFAVGALLSCAAPPAATVAARFAMRRYAKRSSARA